MAVKEGLIVERKQNSNKGEESGATLRSEADLSEHLAESLFGQPQKASKKKKRIRVKKKYS